MLGQLWPRESGTLYKVAQFAGRIGSGALESYAALADTFPFEEECPPTSGGEFGLLVREPVGVVGAIIPWNAPVALICHKIGPALLAGCTVVLKSSPEAPGEGYVFAEVAEQIGLPPGVLNVVTADREVSELLVRDPRRRQDHLHRFDRGGPSHRVVVRRADRALHARARREVGGRDPRRHGPRDRGEDARARRVRASTGQVCSSLTRIVVTKNRHDELVDALAGSFATGSGRRSVRRADRRWDRWWPNASATGSRATSPRASTRARRSRPVAVARRTSTAASTSSRPSSATSTTPRRSRAKRSSARC